MKRSRLLLAVLLSLALASQLVAAMSDSSALKNAKALWGPLAMIASIRDTTASNWTRLIGLKTNTCASTFTILGSGFNTWDAAFNDYMANVPPIAGPYAQNLTLVRQAWDNVAVTGAQFYVDDSAVGPSNIPAPQQAITWSTVLNTTTVLNGLHVVCFQAWDAAGNFALTEAQLFRVDQASGMPGQTLAAKAPVQGTTLR